MTTTTTVPATATNIPATFEDALPRIRAVLSRIAETEADRDRQNAHPYEQVTDLAAAGFGLLRVPAEAGGYDVDLPTLFSLLAEAGEADSNIPQIWRGHFTTTEILRGETGPQARRRWLDKIVHGAVFGNAQSESADRAARVRSGDASATRVHSTDSGDRVVDGTKYYSTGSRFADYIRVAAVDGGVGTDPAVDGRDATQDGTSAFVVVNARHPGVRHLDDWDGIGQRLTGRGTTVFTGVPVEADGDLARDQSSVRGLDSFVQIVHLANLAGIARAIVRDTTGIVRGRTRTSRHALTDVAGEDPEVLGVVGRLGVRSLTATSLLETAADTLQQAHDDGREDSFTHAYTVTSAAQVAVIEAVLAAATEAFNAGGSSTVRARVRLDRHWRNARTLASHNPVVYKPRIIGDRLVNGHTPVNQYYPGRNAS